MLQSAQKSDALATTLLILLGILSERPWFDSLSYRVTCLILYRMATYYTKVMERIQSKGDSFVTTEIDRLERLLEGAISDTKKDEFSMRRNILKQFKAEAAKEEL